MLERLKNSMVGAIDGVKSDIENFEDYLADKAFNVSSSGNVRDLNKFRELVRGAVELDSLARNAELDRIKADPEAAINAL